MLRDCVVLFLSIHLFEQIQILDAFILSCNASLQTVRRVTMCPSNISAYEEAVQKKNCLSLAPDAQTCQSFQYHCVLSDDLNYATEVCAPSMYIVGYVCTKFSTIHKSIMRIDGFACNDSFTECPFGYNSTESFKYLPCYANVNKLLPTELPSRREISETVEPWLIVIVIPIMLGIGCLIFCLYTFVYKRRTFRRRQQGMGISMAQHNFPLEVFESENREGHLFPDRGVISSFSSDQSQMQPNENTSLIYERTSEQLQPEEQNTTDNGNLQTEDDALSSISPDLQQTSSNEESSEESEDEKKCNKFRSNEKSKYPGYMKYRTRAKSFNDCKVDWLKDKKEEFARYGFLYQGVDLKTTCFHCGFSKDNWTEKDDIFATHFFPEKSCAYVQYLNTSIEKYVFH